jgi:hypothetical protein
MRRTYSESLEEDTGMVATFKKLKKSLFSRFGNTRRGQQHQQLQQQQQQQDTFNADLSSSFKRSRNSSFQNNSQSQITAKQLEDYYNSLKRENELLTDNLKNSTNNNKEINSTSNNYWKDAESTNIVQDFNDQEINNINVNDDNDDNGIILLEEKNIENNDFSINDMTYSGLLPLFSQPDPLERANLVQLKKMMELEKYRKYRLNYLREHTRHLKQSNLDKTGQHVKKPKHLKYQTKLDLKNLPSNRKNKSGTFGISLLNTLEDNEPEKDDLVRPINDNPVKKLKFPNAKENAIKFELPSKPRSFNAEEQKPVGKLEKHENVKIETPATKAPIPDTKLELNSESSNPAAENIDASIDDKPTAAFSFGSLPKSSTHLFTNGKTDEVGEPKPTFNFDNSTNKKPIILETLPDKDGLNDPKMDFISKAQSHNSPVESKTPSFTFDLKSKESKTTSDSKIPSLFDSKQPSNPLFSFETQKASSNSEKPESTKISFKPSESNVANEKKVNFESKPAPTFSFGKPATSENLTVPKLSFGLDKPANQSTEAESKPIFTFKTLTTQKEPEEKKIVKPTFSFGQTTSDKSSTIPAFSFGTTVNKPPVSTEQTEKTSDKEKPLFGNLADKSGDLDTKEKPKSVFNAFAQPSSTDEKSKDVPNLDFGSFGSAVDKKAEASAKPFGGFSSAAASNKQSMDIPKSTSDGFTFSGTISENKASGLSFDKTGTQENKTQKPSFNFSGSNGSASPTVFGSRDPMSANKTVINFGGNNVVPSLDIGGPNANKNTVFESDATRKSEPVFKFGEGTSSNELSLQDPKRKKMQDSSSGVGSTLQFGNSSLATKDTGLFSGFGNNLKTTNTNSTNNTVNNQPSSAFSFGGNTAKLNSTNTFNASSNSNSNNVTTKTGFGASNPASASASGFSFGSGSTNSEFGQPNKNTNNALAVASGPTQTPGKLFSFNGNAFPSLDNAPKPNGFGDMTSSNFSFGANFNNNNNINNNNNNNNNSGFGIGSAFGGNNTMNSSGGVFGGNNNKGTGFNFGGSMPSSLTTSRASTPNFNFTGQNNLDPAAIFGAGGSNNQMTQMGMNQAGMNQMGMNQMGVNQNLPASIPTRRKAQLRRSRRG